MRARGTEFIRTSAVSSDPFTCPSYSTRLAVGVRCALHSTVAVYLPFLPSFLRAKDEISQLGIQCGDGLSI